MLWLAVLAGSFDAFPAIFGLVHLDAVSWLAMRVLQALGARATRPPVTAGSTWTASTAS